MLGPNLFLVGCFYLFQPNFGLPVPHAEEPWCEQVTFKLPVQVCDSLHQRHVSLLAQSLVRHRKLLHFEQLRFSPPVKLRLVVSRWGKVCGDCLVMFEIGGFFLLQTVTNFVDEM